MIAPEDCEGAVDRLRFVVGSVRGEKQLTAVEIATNRTENGFVIHFFVPTPFGLRDELGRLGPDFVNNVMEAWDLKESEFPRESALPVAFERCPEESTELSGCTHWVRVAIPPGDRPKMHLVAWSHAPLEGGTLFVPTQNETLSSWRADIAVLRSRDNKYGSLPRRPIAEPEEARFAVDEAFLVRQHNAAMPFHNLYFAPEARPASSRDFMGASGARLVDATKSRLVSFCDVGFQTVPVVCGCYVRDGLNFNHAHIPLTIVERATRERPIVFRDGPEGSNSVVFEAPGGHAISIGLLEREEFGGVIWVTARKADDGALRD